MGCNPLLVASVFIASIIEGLDQGLDPGPQIEGNGYEVAPDSDSMPGDWAEAIQWRKNLLPKRGVRGGNAIPMLQLKRLNI